MSELFPLSSWSLLELLHEPIDDSLEKSLNRIETVIVKIENERSQLTSDISENSFLELLENYQEFGEISQRLSAFAYLWIAQDSHNQDALAFRGKLSLKLAEAGNRIMFFELWFKNLPEEAASRLMKVSGDTEYYLRSLRIYIPHTLTEIEEKTIQLKDINGIDALVNLYEMIASQLKFNLEVEGEQKILSRDGLVSYFRHPSPEVRAATYQELNRVIADNSVVLSQIYHHRVQDWRIEAIEMRNYSSPIAVRNLANDLPDSVVDTLLASCRKNAGVFQQYFHLKARWLDMPKLRRYDIYAPLSQSKKQYSFNTAVDMVLDSFEKFSPIMAENARRVFKENHLDSELRAGKRSGAFCFSAVPGLTPWVMVNFAGKARDVATLAHELGHAIHAIQASGHSILTYRAALPLAETASIFAEMLLTERLLELEDDRAVQRDLLAHAIDSAYATVIRQAYFTIFERDAHQIIADGLPVDELNKRYMETLFEQFGDSVELEEDFKWEWVSIPHIIRSPFYTYAYSFGQLLVLALYQQYRSQNSDFQAKYFRILSSGGAESPMDILISADIDIESADFWQGGFDVLSGMIRRLEML